MSSQPRDSKGRFVSNVDADSLSVDRLDFARRVGIQYAGQRDIYKVAGYKRNPAFEDFWSYYDRHPIAARIVDMPPKATWRKDPEIVDDPDSEDDTEFMAQVRELAKRVSLWRRMEKVDRLARIGQYAVLLIGVKGQPRLELPLGKLSGPDDVAYLAQYSERHAKIASYVEKNDDDRYGLPEFYNIDLSRGGQGMGAAGATKVHWTRVIHVAEDSLLDDIHGRPALLRVLNTIFDDMKVDAASAEAFWQLADKILQMKIEKDSNISDPQLAALDVQLREIDHDLRRRISIRGGELAWLGGDTPDPGPISEVIAGKLAAGSGIPMRILFGSERGELASSQDERNWLGSIGERQEQHAGPGLVREFIDRLLEFGGLVRPGVEDYEVQWPNLYELSDKEIQERNQATAETAKSLTAVGGDPYDLVEIDEDRNVWLRPKDDVMADRKAEEEENRKLMEEGLLPTPPGMDPNAEDDPEGEEGVVPPMEQVA